MSQPVTTLDYYFSPASPWTYLGHERFVAMAQAAKARVNVRPVDLAVIFPATGGLPLGQRAPARQAYRLVELQRVAHSLGLPINLHPAHFPVAGDAAARLLVAVAQQDGADAALQLAGATMVAVWVQERDIASERTLAALLDECALPAQRLQQSQTPAVQAAYEANTQAALAAGVFGAPSYVLAGEIFWGQDRLDYLQRALNPALPPTATGA